MKIDDDFYITDIAKFIIKTVCGELGNYVVVNQQYNALAVINQRAIKIAQRN